MQNTLQPCRTASAFSFQPESCWQLIYWYILIKKTLENFKYLLKMIVEIDCQHLKECQVYSLLSFCCVIRFENTKDLISCKMTTFFAEYVAWWLIL